MYNQVERLREIIARRVAANFPEANRIIQAERTAAAPERLTCYEALGRFFARHSAVETRPHELEETFCRMLNFHTGGQFKIGA